MDLYIPICPACGAAIDLTVNTSHIICKYCNGPIIIQNAQAQGNPSVDGNPTIFDKIQSGYDLLNLNQFERAYKIFYDLVESFPNNSRVWWGIVLAGTCNLTAYVGEGQTFRNETQNALRFAPREEAREIEYKYNYYINWLNASLAEQYQNDTRRSQFVNPSVPSWKQKPTKKGFFSRK